MRRIRYATQRLRLFGSSNCFFSSVISTSEVVTVSRVSWGDGWFGVVAFEELGTGRAVESGIISSDNENEGSKSVKFVRDRESMLDEVSLEMEEEESVKFDLNESLLNVLGGGPSSSE